MGQDNKTSIVVQVRVNAPLETAWMCWTTPEDIVEWNNASDDWHTLRAENDLKPGGRFSYRMEAKNGSMGFDFEGVYDKVIARKRIDYTIGDGRKVSVAFSTDHGKTLVAETFETESLHPLEIQRDGWQAILNNFKRHVEEKGGMRNEKLPTG